MNSCSSLFLIFFFPKVKVYCYRVVFGFLFSVSFSRFLPCSDSYIINYSFLDDAFLFCFLILRFPSFIFDYDFVSFYFNFVFGFLVCILFMIMDFQLGIFRRFRFIFRIYFSFLNYCYKYGYLVSLL